MSYQHLPVMLTEILEYLAPCSGQKFIDCTLGGAGYTLALAARVGQKGKVLGIDLDELAINNAQQKIVEGKFKNIILVQDNFKNLSTIVGDNFPSGTRFSGIVFDLGLSSAQLADQSRGFSFQGERPLDMAFGPGNQRSTVSILNHYSLLELTRIFREYGEERRAYQIAKAIINARRKKPFKTTADLTAVIEKVTPFRFYSKIHPATRVFQALRIETNDELTSLAQTLPHAVELLDKGGKLIVVSFHSGEDRIVKKFFKENTQLQILTKKPVEASEQEISNNSRARSAKLRVAQKLDNF